MKIIKRSLFFGLALLFSAHPALVYPFISKDNANENFLTKASNAMNKIAQKASPAVVSISAVKSATQPQTRFDVDPQSPDQKTMGIGSGVIIRSNGFILTNHHVIEEAERITVSLDENQKIPAHLVGSDPKTDLAIIKIDLSPATQLATLNFGDSEQTKVGDWTLAIGSPFGLSHSVTLGIVSAIGREQLGMLDIEDFIQTDAAINPGNSGGPLLNSNGEIIGINTAIFSQSGGFMGIGFSIPSRIAKQVSEDILKYGHVIRGWMGMNVQDLDSDLAKYFKVPIHQGALISLVQPHGPAEKARLKAGDVIVKFGSKKISSSRQLKTLVAKASANLRVPIEISRQGQIKHFSVLISEQPNTNPKQLAGKAASLAVEKTAKPYFGLSVQDIPPEFGEIFGIAANTGALITHVKAGSPAFDAGLTPGDIILSANQNEVRNAQDFIRSVQQTSNHHDLTVLYIQRGPEEKLFIPLKPLV